MLIKRPAQERGSADYGWLDTKYSFSFSEYFDPAHMGFGPLRVINDDRLAGGGGFDTHGHRDMEILTYVLDGAVEHRDSTGSHGVTRSGEIQRMSAGTGIRHSEFNHSSAEQLRLLQIWILPESKGLKPEYEQKSIAVHQQPGRLHVIAARNPPESAVLVHQDVIVYAGRFGPGDSAELDIALGRGIWVQAARGGAMVNGMALAEGDGLAVSEESALRITEGQDAELLVFDLPLK